MEGVRVRATVQAVVQVLSGYPAKGSTNLTAPVSFYMPTTTAKKGRKAGRDIVTELSSLHRNGCRASGG